MILRSFAFVMSAALGLVLIGGQASHASQLSFGDAVALGTLDEYNVDPDTSTAFASGLFETLLLPDGEEFIFGLFDLDAALDTNGNPTATLTVFEIASSVTGGFDLFLTGALYQAKSAAGGVDLVFHQLVGEGEALFGDYAGLRLSDPAFPGFSASQSNGFNGFGEAELRIVNPAPVPLPATGLLMIVAFSALGLTRNRWLRQILP